MTWSFARCESAHRKKNFLSILFQESNPNSKVSKLVVGYLLDELKNDITRETPA